MLAFELESFLEGLKLLQEGGDLRLNSSEHGLSFLDEALVLSFERSLGNNCLKTIFVENAAANQLENFLRLRKSLE